MSIQFFQNLSDKELIALLKTDSPQKQNKAFRYLYQKVFVSVEKFVVRNGGAKDDALDIFQDAIIILNNQIKENRFKHSSTVSTYLFSIAKNLWYQFFNKNKRYVFTTSFSNKETMLLNYDDLESISNTEKMEVLLQKLDPDCREILLLYYYENSSMSEIKLHFNLGSDQAAKNKKYRCIKKLEELFKKHNIQKDTFDFDNE